MVNSSVRCEDKDTNETFTKHLFIKEDMMKLAISCNFTEKMKCVRCGEMQSLSDIVSSIPDNDKTKKAVLFLMKKANKLQR